MTRAAERNKYQRAAHRPGERRVSRSQVPELLELSRSDDVEERLIAAKYLCPCHTRGSLPEVWSAIYRMMEDADARVRFAAWHTLEDGGLPPEPEARARLEELYHRERDRKVRRMAEIRLGPILAGRRRQALMAMQRATGRLRGKCDFCGERDLAVERDLDTMIPTDTLPRPALICQRCAGASALRTQRTA
ncbi:MAG TPA: HEAT repeat domain-containing protein [Caulobacteraceae bacterium]|nr:HEAT repeat domain-containing protein [Caulobacteraceae bacterium]